MRQQIYIYDRSLRGTNRLPLPERIIELDSSPTEGPLVSCLMVTRGDPAFVRASIACFTRQTYANRELVVVCDAVTPELQQLIVESGSEVRLVGVEPGLSLGILRNLSIEHARGELVCQWDDDDIYGPSRLSQGIGALLQADAEAMFLRQWLIWAPAQQLLSVSNSRVWEGSMIAFRRVMPVYPDMRRGEDTAMVNLIFQQRRVALLDAPLSYCYCIHGRNTFPDPHMQEIIRYSRLKFSYEKGLAAFSSILDFASHPATTDADRARLARSQGDVVQSQRLNLYMAISGFLRRGHHRVAQWQK